MGRVTIIFCLSLLLSNFLSAQQISDVEIKRRINLYKSDVRGPFKEIRWYCPDGSIIPPQERCLQPGGVQRARHKDEVTKLAETNHIFLGQILATTPFSDFWDAENYQSRLKQYQLEKFLKASDNGWILRKAQYYRGAYQAEDEENWGIGFFNWLLQEDRILEKHFFLVRQAVKDIPHAGDDNLSQNIRIVSKNISDAYPPFQDIRVKIHGQPDVTDIESVKRFRKAHEASMPYEIIQQMDQLINDLESRYSPFDASSIKEYAVRIPRGLDIYNLLDSFSENYRPGMDEQEKISILSALLADLRLNILSAKSADARLAILDISIIIEDLLFREQSAYLPATLEDQLAVIYNLGLAATGCGYLEIWEWDHLESRLLAPEGKKVMMDELIGHFEAGRNLIEWGTGMFMATYGDVVVSYSGFEQMAESYIDEKVRSSLLLPAGIALSDLGDHIAAHLLSSNEVMDIRGQSSVRGLNPGMARGELVVTSGNPEEVTTDRDKIYIFNKPPSDLKPVNGIATVTEGNPVSHVQLLARNLGIPNAVISMQNLEELKKYNGQVVFYAVSPGGAVVMKPEDQMTGEEKGLFEKRARSENRISIDVNRINLSHKNILSLRDIDASASGRICGPKAANLAQLKQMFPDKVVEGLIIPFGIFREHLDQPMDDDGLTYWDFLTSLFRSPSSLKENGWSERQIEEYIMEELEKFRQAITRIPLSDKFVTELRTSFREIFGKSIGEIPVFLRSDTNMEDLKDFTGAGLNLTLFNVVAEEIILQGIRDVWASPYTERSYRWRQKYLMNPENVFPSILIIPSVDVDYSGVVVTRGISSGEAGDITIAFNRGAGGAVDGQAAESYLLRENDGNILLAPAREPLFRSLPVTGGVIMNFTTFESPVVNPSNIYLIRETAGRIRTVLPNTPGVETTGPFDIELGFKNDELWLFQVRPFVENKNAAGSLYLESMDIPVPLNRNLDLNDKIKR